MTKNTIQINGSKYKCCNTLTINDLLMYLGFKIEIILINYNGLLIPKNLLGKVFIKNNDCLEIITIAGGG